MKAIILFCGPDGSGKTTIARLLSYYLKKRGIKTSIFWIRGSHIIIPILAKFLRKFDSFKGTDNPYYNISIPRKMLDLWIFLEFISILPLILWRIIIKSLRFTVIGERSPLDFIVWIISTTRRPEFLLTIYGKFMLILVMKWKPIFLYASIDVLCLRKQSECRFIKRTMPIYMVLSKNLNIPSIETSDNIYNVFTRVLEKI